MRVLVGCEFSGIVRDAFLAAGHDALSCDLLPTDRLTDSYQVTTSTEGAVGVPTLPTASSVAARATGQIDIPGVESAEVRAVRHPAGRPDTEKAASATWKPAGGHIKQMHEGAYSMKATPELPRAYADSASDHIITALVITKDPEPSLTEIGEHINAAISDLRLMADTLGIDLDKLDDDLEWRPVPDPADGSPDPVASR